MNLEHISSIISVVGTCFGLVSRVPQVYKTYKTRSANDLSDHLEINPGIVIIKLGATK